MKKVAVKKKAEKKSDPAAPLCFNCDAEMAKAALFCTQLCQQEASFVRQVRKWQRQGRASISASLAFLSTDAEIAKTIKVKLALIQGGGYPEREREVPPAIRQKVKTRARGMCEAEGCGRPGADVDHIDGSSNELSNLQYLCKPCHDKKTLAGVETVLLDDPRYPALRAKREALAARIIAKTPQRDCDDQETWDTAQRAYMQERKLFFAAKAEAAPRTLF